MRGSTSAAASTERMPAAKRYAALVEDLRRRCGGEVRRGVLAAKHGRAEFQLRPLPKQQGFVVSVACRSAARYKVTRKGALDRRMEAFVPAIRFHSRDARFDDEFNVQTRDPQAAAAVLTRRASRAAVRRLFARGAQSVGLAENGVTGTCNAKAFGGRPGAEDVLGLVEDLGTIAEVVTSSSARRGGRPAAGKDLALVGAWTTLGALGVLGFAMLVGGSIEFTLVQPARFLLPCALVGLPAVVPVVLALVLLVQHRTAPYGLVRGLAGVSLLVVPLFVSGALLVANGLFDPAPAEEHVVTVLDKRVREKDDELRYHAGLASWWIEGDVRWLRVSKATYDQLVPNVSGMRVRTRPGKLGYAWIESTSPAP